MEPRLDKDSGTRVGAFPSCHGVASTTNFYPILFSFVMDELTHPMQGEVSWCILIADDKVLIHKTRGVIDPIR